MRVLQINKFYPFEKIEGKEPSRPYSYGGSEAVVLSTSLLLKKYGHEVLFFSMNHPDGLQSEFSDYFIPYVDFGGNSFARNLESAANIFYSGEARKMLGRLLDAHPVDIAHLHNFHHQISPSILLELRKRKIPVVMSLHDYKLVCPSYNMLNHDRICELCKGGRFYNSFRTRCHKNSFSKSLIVTMESYLNHDILNSYKDIKCYICPSRFIMDKTQEMGLKGNFIHIPHFVDPSRFRAYSEKEKDVRSGVYWGRLSVEKGVDTLLSAVTGSPVNMMIVGDGPLQGKVEGRINKEEIINVRLFPRLYGEDLISMVNSNAFSVLPSEWYEVFGLTIIESYAMGMPVIGARIGGIPELIKDGETGLLFEPGNADDLRSKIKDLISDPAKAIRMGRNGRTVVEQEHGPDLYYQRLMEVYNKAIGS